MGLLLTRRQWFNQVGAGFGVAGLLRRARPKGAGRKVIQTVLGPIPAAAFGFALPHEHVLCDFIGAEKTGRARWNVDEVVAAILPNLVQLKSRGVSGFVDCTPAYIGRDPRVLQKLARQTGIHILTNTGYYGGMNDRFVPKHAHEESVAQLAARWIGEWKNGIEDTGVKPGFVKIGVDEIPETAAQLSAIDAKLVRAAAQTSRETGLSVTCHTGGGPSGYAAARLFLEERGDPARLVVAHSDGHGYEYNRKIAALGSWVSFDGIGYRTPEEHLKIVLPMVEKHADRVLLSMDKGWWWVGEPKGGNIQNYNYLSDTWLPTLRNAGVSEALIHRLTVDNPARAFEL
jgi:predicted metal-dependent phosphotriesterase family hydrolase